MACESNGVWSTAPFEFIDGFKSDVARRVTAGTRGDWIEPAADSKALAEGAVLSKLFVKEGSFSLEWKRHAQYPTIACRTIEHNWSGYKGISFWLYSTVATGDVITLGVQSDSAETKTNDYYLYDFKVDWVGWKKQEIALSAFAPLGRPVGWDKTDALLFFSKAKWQDPDPRTTLYLDGIQLLKTEPAAPATAGGEDAAVSGANARLKMRHQYPVKLNHAQPEVEVPFQKGAHEVQSLYFNGARSRYGYYPKYDPGYVSFGPTGRPYIRSPLFLQTLGADGKWITLSFDKALQGYAEQKKWAGVALRLDNEDPVVRFDAAGDLYMISTLLRLNERSEEIASSSVLLHSRDQGVNWTIYTLPTALADFEKLDANNTDCLKYPPAIILAQLKYRANADQASYLLVPKKKPDGTLLLPPEILIAENALTGPVHSGGGNFMVSRGDKIFLIYGDMAPLENGARAKTAEANIPANHPARAMTFIGNGKVVEARAETGVPTYVVEYDRKTEKLSRPVFVGFGGQARDNHNWGAITLDSKGGLHVVINGHIDPIMYTYSLKPGDITAWSPPVYLAAYPGTKLLTIASYASLNCDRNDNLLCVFRADGVAYNHRLATLRKPAGKPWDKERSLVVPFNMLYHVWSHKVAYDRQRDRYFVAYNDQPGSTQMSRDTYSFYRFIWPAGELAMAERARQISEEFQGLPAEGVMPSLIYPGAAEMTVMVTDDGGVSWRYATTPDFLPKR